MNNIVKVAKARYRQFRTWQHRERLRRELLGWNDQLLADMGFSRLLLKRGVQTWPWREEVETVQPGDAIRRPKAEVDHNRYVA